jgi:hypothetical protein
MLKFSMRLGEIALHTISQIKDGFYLIEAIPQTNNLQKFIQFCIFVVMCAHA